jgi:hypothetical protein
LGQELIVRLKPDLFGVPLMITVKEEKANIQNELAPCLDTWRGPHLAHLSLPLAETRMVRSRRHHSFAPGRRGRRLGTRLQTAGDADRGVVGRAAHGVCLLHVCSSTRAEPRDLLDERRAIRVFVCRIFTPYAHLGDLRSRLRAATLRVPETRAQQRRNPFAERRATMGRGRETRAEQLGERRAIRIDRNREDQERRGKQSQTGDRYPSIGLT